MMNELRLKSLGKREEMKNAMIEIGNGELKKN